MKITIPQEYTSISNLPVFEIPDFVEKMDEFIAKARVLNEEKHDFFKKITHLGIVGIGGSQVQPLVFRPHSKVKVSHLEVPDPYVLKELLKEEDLQVLYISRSGQTKEVLSFVPYLIDYPTMVVTNGGHLKEIAEIMRWPTIPVSHDISGRFAIQNELGIVPMIAMGIDPVEFLSELKKSYDEHFKSGSAAEKTALAIFNLEKKNIAKMRVLPSGAYTQGLGILLTQLLNESVPKHPDDKIDVSLHIMPRSAHSDLQRWYGGVKDSSIFSISCQGYQESAPDKEVADKVRQLLPGSRATSGEHLNITTLAVEDTFPGPVFKVVLEEDSITELASCIGFFHAMTVRLCQIKGSPPFDQPAVQLYKERASEIYKEIE
ncbi:MAG: hypothetical protein INQ03_22270 [Candidatus Heimdallarchaeota archaeon]|nr:hypothetical protein [Candidatus Heimdallarchaeota archaeon]